LPAKLSPLVYLTLRVVNFARKPRSNRIRACQGVSQLRIGGEPAAHKLLERADPLLERGLPAKLPPLVCLTLREAVALGLPDTPRR
jgi:hypothetical protein